MSRLSTATSILCSAGLSLSAILPATAQSPSKFYQFQEQRFRNFCPPRLKYAAGACVRRCPAGYEDNGWVCRFRSMRGGGGR